MLQLLNVVIFLKLYDCINAIMYTSIHVNEIDNTVESLIRDLNPYTNDSSNGLLRLIILEMPTESAY